MIMPEKDRLPFLYDWQIQGILYELYDWIDELDLDDDYDYVMYKNLEQVVEIVLRNAYLKE